jgi:hypothetical protein
MAAGFLPSVSGNESRRRGKSGVVRSGLIARRLVTGGREPTVSPDGRRLAFVRDNHLWIPDRNGAGARPVTSGPVAEAEPDWGQR